MSFLLMCLNSIWWAASWYTQKWPPEFFWLVKLDHMSYRGKWVTKVHDGSHIFCTGWASSLTLMGRHLELAGNVLFVREVWLHWWRRWMWWKLKWVTVTLSRRPIARCGRIVTVMLRTSKHCTVLETKFQETMREHFSRLPIGLFCRFSSLWTHSRFTWATLDFLSLSP